MWGSINQTAKQTYFYQFHMTRRKCGFQSSDAHWQEPEGEAPVFHRRWLKSALCHAHWFDLPLWAQRDIYTFRTCSGQLAAIGKNSSPCLRIHCLLSHSEDQDKPWGISAEHSSLHHIIIFCKYRRRDTKTEYVYIWPLFIGMSH